MSRIDFVPDEYVQQRESNRVNWLYIGLLIAVLAGIGITFGLLEMRRDNMTKELAALDLQLSKAQEHIKLLDELEVKGRTMMKTALITAELPDLIGKSVILACLTNNLPGGVSLTDLRISDSETMVKVTADKSASQYEAAKAAAASKKAPVEKSITNTNINIAGVAPSDIEVANYIAILDESFLIKNVGLVESIEKKLDNSTYRQFKLNVKLNRDVKITKERIDQLRLLGKN